jgi:hypothetical protein
MATMATMATPSAETSEKKSEVGWYDDGARHPSRTASRSMTCVEVWISNV